jgi:hypothetical protein
MRYSSKPSLTPQFFKKELVVFRLFLNQSQHHHNTTQHNTRTHATPPPQQQFNRPIEFDPAAAQKLARANPEPLRSKVSADKPSPHALATVNTF